MSWPRLGLTGGTLAIAIVALAFGGAVAGTATGARVAAQAAPPADVAGELPGDPATGAGEKPLPPQLHSVLGRVAAVRGEFIGVRTPAGTVVRVHVLPRTAIRKAGKRVAMEAIERGDRVVAVGRVNPNGVLQARGLLVQRTPLSRPNLPPDGGPAEGTPAPPPPAGSSGPRPKPAGAPAPVPPAVRTALALPPAPAEARPGADPAATRVLPPALRTALAAATPTPGSAAP
ncbi:MAG TPA: hypothetical protein VII06_40235 [Chloroflexota bacterium]|jgi:hypothetical protein